MRRVASEKMMLKIGGLLNAARERTGLRNLGDEWFLEPMEWLIDSMKSIPMRDSSGLIGDR